MEINPEIKSILQECKLDYDKGLTFLLSLHYKLDTSYLPYNFQTISTTGIVKIEQGNIVWKVALFKGQEIAFEWVVSEYCILFEPAGKNKNHREAVSRMKKLFSQNPELRKEEVLEATRLYISQTDLKYTKFPHYFIEKGVGAAKEQSILDWVDTYRISQSQKNNRDIYNNLQ